MKNSSLLPGLSMLGAASVMVLAAWIGQPVLGVALGIGILALSLGARHLSRRISSGRTNTSGPLWSTPLVCAPIVAALGTSAVAMPLLVGSTLITLRSGPARLRYQLPILGAFSASLGLVWLRPSYPALSIFAVSIALMILIVVSRCKDRQTALLSLLDGVGLYLLVSLLSYAFGLRSRSEGVRVAGLGSSFLIFPERVLFPLARSFAETPSVAAAYTIAVIPLLVRFRDRRALRIACLGSAVLILLAANGRLALAVATLFGLALLVSPKVLSSIAVPVAAACILFPFAFSHVQSLLGDGIDEITSQIPALERPGERSASLNNRDTIWANSISHFGCCVPVERQILGAGQNGHVRSGAASTYNQIFSQFSSDSGYTAHVHSSSLQMLFNTGLIGLALWSIGLLGVAWKVSARARGGDAVYLSALGLTMGLIATSVTEITLAGGFQQVPIWLFFALAAIVSSTERRPYSATDDVVGSSNLHNGSAVPPFNKMVHSDP